LKFKHFPKSYLLKFLKNLKNLTITSQFKDIMGVAFTFLELISDQS